MKKPLAWMAWLSLSAVSPVALAVSLGQASVSSYLNAPLDASIPLLESQQYALDTIHVSVAEPSAFTAAGLEWTPLAADVRVQIQEQQGRRQVRLRSDQPIEEPWLELLFTLEYPGGQQLRDITLLFDPQSYSQQQESQQGYSQPQQGYSQQGYSQQGSSQQDQTQSAVTTVPSTSNAGSAYIGNGDTLWSVAGRIKPDRASVQQMMVALLEANPGVFPSGNINDMRAGQALEVPNAERVLARSHASADAAIKAMNEAWRARRNGSLEEVPLAQVEAASAPEAAPVSEAAIAAAQALQADQLNTPGGALAAGGLEVAVPEGVMPGADDSETPEAGALTRTELTEQLRLSQATLQQVLEERALLRSELNALRGEVASLSEALSDALAAQEQSPMPLVASMDETGKPDLIAFIERYQWPLALAAIALLLALLVWLRKRREETWQDVPLDEPVVRPAVSPKVAPQSTPVSEAVHVTYPEPPGEVDEAHYGSRQSTLSQHYTQPDAEAEEEPELEPEAEPELDPPHRSKVDAPATAVAPTIDTDQWLVDDQGQVPAQDDTLRYKKSQASGLAEQGRQRRLGLHPVAADSGEGVSLAPPPSAKPMNQLLASIEAGLPASDPATADAHLQQTEKPSRAADPGHRFIDYHPPVLNTANSSVADSQEGARNQTPMQPTVEFASEQHAEPLPAAKQVRRPIDEEWEIEEVAFKPRGLDNSDPSKSSK